MSNVKAVEVNTIDPIHIENIGNFVSQDSHETIQLEVVNGVLNEIFIPKFQTHKISVVRGKVVLVLWRNRDYQDISLDEKFHKVIVIPPNVPYGFINLNLEPSVVVNAVVHHPGSKYKLDHCPVDKPLVYDNLDPKAPLKVVPRVS